MPVFVASPDRRERVFGDWTDSENCVGLWERCDGSPRCCGTTHCYWQDGYSPRVVRVAGGTHHAWYVLQVLLTTRGTSHGAYSPLAVDITGF